MHFRCIPLLHPAAADSCTDANVSCKSTTILCSLVHTTSRYALAPPTTHNYFRFSIPFHAPGGRFAGNSQTTQYNPPSSSSRFTVLSVFFYHTRILPMPARAVRRVHKGTQRARPLQRQMQFAGCSFPRALTVVEHNVAMENDATPVVCYALVPCAIHEFAGNATSGHGIFGFFGHPLLRFPVCD